MTESEYSLIKNRNDHKYINMLALQKLSLLVILQEDFILCICEEEDKTRGSFSIISSLYTQNHIENW